MKLLMTSVAVILSTTFVAGMGCKSKDISTTNAKVLPESTKVSVTAPMPQSAPIKLSENAAAENKKDDEKLSRVPAKTDSPTSPKKPNKKKPKKKTKASKKAQVKVEKANKES